MAAQIVVPGLKQFNGVGFSAWSYRVRLHLEKEGVLHVLKEDPPSTKTGDEAASTKFMKSDLVARDVLAKWLDDRILMSISQKTTAKQMWKALEDTYLRKGLSAQVELRQEISDLRFKNCSLREFLESFDSKIADFEAAGGVMSEQEVITNLLSKMPPAFQQITLAIDIATSQDNTKVSLEFVKNRLLMAEKKLGYSKSQGHTSSVSSGVADQNVFSAGNFGGRSWEKFPQKKGIRGKRGQASSSRQTASSHSEPGKTNDSNSEFPWRCHYCKQFAGHRSRDCPQRKFKNTQNSNQSANTASAQESFHEVAFSGSLEENSQEIAFGCSSQTVGPVSHNQNIFLDNGANLNSKPKQNVLLSSDVQKKVLFFADSGCTSHLCTEEVGKFLFDVEHVNVEISVAKQGEKLRAVKRGSLRVLSNGKTIKLLNVLLCEQLPFNLLSVSKMEQAGLKIVFAHKKVTVSFGESVVMEGNLEGSMYAMYLEPVPVEKAAAVADHLLHRKMGHSSTYPVKGLCEVCVRGKQTRTPFVDLPEARKPKRLLEVISGDIKGPITPQTFDGCRFFVTFTDHFSNFTHVYLLRSKAEALEKFKEYVATVTSRFLSKIGRARFDNGGEFSSEQFRSFCRDSGIEVEYTIPRNPSQNGKSERLMRTIFSMARCLVLDSGCHLGKPFWGEAVRTAVFLINRLSTKALPNRKTPAEVWYGYPPDLGKIRLFGCRAYAHIPKEDRKSTLDPISRVVYMVGYCPNGWRLYCPDSGKIIRARSVRFEEVPQVYTEPEVPSGAGIGNASSEDGSDAGTLPESGGDVESEEFHETTSDFFDLPSTTLPTGASHLESLPASVEAPAPNPDPPVRTSGRVRHLPPHLLDYELDLFAALSVGCLPSETPTKYQDAVRDDGWRAAVDEELRNMARNGTWEIVPAPKNQALIDSKWVFRQKLLDNSVVKRARLVARGFMEDTSDLSPSDLYAPVARMSTLRLLLAIAVERDLTWFQFDVKAAFLCGVLDRPVFMKPPKGLNVPEGHVCRLVKSLYGLKSAPKTWNSTLNEHLISIGMVRSKVDPCLYVKGGTYLLVWVDDIIVFTPNLSRPSGLSPSMLSTILSVTWFQMVRWR